MARLLLDHLWVVAEPSGCDDYRLGFHLSLVAGSVLSNYADDVLALLDQLRYRGFKGI